jgi:hypothetical protein
MAWLRENHIIQQNNSALAAAAQRPGAFAEQRHGGDAFRVSYQQIGSAGRRFHRFFNYRAT